MGDAESTWSVIGMSDAPKSTVPLVTWVMPPPEPIDCVVDLHAGMRRAVFVEPLRVDRIGKCSAGPGEFLRLGRAQSQRKQANCQKCLFHESLPCSY